METNLILKLSSKTLTEIVTFLSEAVTIQKNEMGIPKGLFVCRKRNCSHKDDYIEQTDVLIKRFIDKAYSHDNLQLVRKTVGEMDRQKLLEDKVREQKSYDMSFITGFNKQFKHLEKRIRKHWPF